MKEKIVGVMPLYCDEKKSIWMLPAYMDMLSQAGAIPLILPQSLTENEISAIDEICAGYLFTGGHDIDPKIYGEKKSDKCGETNEKRDRLEKKIFESAYKKDKPVLGICRGIQFINAAMGGTLYQDIPSEINTPIEHHMTPPYNRAVHNVSVKKGGILYDILKTEALGVNSYHHQGIKKLGKGLKTEAVSEDGITEAISCENKKFILGVQWHPEFSYKTDESSFKIICAFVMVL